MCLFLHLTTQFLRLRGQYLGNQMFYSDRVTIYQFKQTGKYSHKLINYI